VVLAGAEIVGFRKCGSRVGGSVGVEVGVSGSVRFNDYGGVVNVLPVGVGEGKAALGCEVRRKGHYGKLSALSVTDNGFGSRYRWEGGALGTLMDRLICFLQGGRKLR
jgi:hypothetical protein